MNAIKTMFFIFFILFIFLISSYCSLQPWKKIKFVSCPEHMELLEKNGFNKCVEKYPEASLDDIFLYAVSNGSEESMYSSTPPYSLNFVFYTYNPNAIIAINSINVLADDNIELPVDNSCFPLKIELRKSGFARSESWFGYYELEYAYKLQKYKMLYATVNVSTENEDGVTTKNLFLKLERDVKWGLFQYRF